MAPTGRSGLVEKKLVFGYGFKVRVDGARRTEKPAMQLQVKTLLNDIQHFVGFVYRDVRRVLNRQGRTQRIEIRLEAHTQIPGRCSRCRQPAPQYDRLPERAWLFVPLWG